MKKRISPWSCLFFGLAILFLLVVGGAAWWYFGSRPQTSDEPPPSTVFVTLLSPSSADEVQAGDFVPVSMKAVALTAIQSAELFVDGQSLGVVTDLPENAAWAWQAWPVGVHSLLARATAADGQVGQSQTVLVNVLAGDGLMQIPAVEGLTLEQIGAAFDVPPDQMAAANPQVDPTQPLPDGQPVQVPASNGEDGNSSGENSAGSGDSPSNSIVWKIKTNKPVEKSYCYTTTGGGIWEKIPKQPFDFFQSQDNVYTQLNLIIQDQVNVVQMQCWGWLGDVLTYLGQAGTKLDITQPDQPLIGNGDNFQFVGIPDINTPIITFTGGGMKTVPPPFALREPKDASDCTAHSNPILAPFICNTVMKAPVKEFIILEWEWQPEPPCWPGYCQYGINKIDGYRVIDVDKNNVSHLLKDINNPSQKITMIPLPWGEQPCYVVIAYVKDPPNESTFSKAYCPGDVPVPQKITVYPSEWITTGGQWVHDGDCDTYGGKDNYAYHNENTGFGNQAGQVLVGSYIVDDDDEDCYREGNYSGAVKFSLIQTILPPGASIHNAQLKFSSSFVDYGATAYASPKPATCVSGVGQSKLDWGSMVGANHFSSKNLSSPTYFIPISTLAEFQAPTINVTSAVNTWLKYPEKNHGFILTPASAPHPKEDGQGRCLSGLNNFVLEIEYFAP